MTWHSVGWIQIYAPMFCMPRDSVNAGVHIGRSNVSSIFVASCLSASFNYLVTLALYLFFSLNRSITLVVVWNVAWCLALAGMR